MRQRERQSPARGKSEWILPVLDQKATQEWLDKAATGIGTSGFGDFCTFIYNFAPWPSNQVTQLYVPLYSMDGCTGHVAILWTCTDNESINPQSPPLQGSLRPGVRTENEASAMSILNLLLSKKGPSAQVCAARAELHMKQHNNTAALHDAKTAVALDPSYAKVRGLLRRRSREGRSGLLWLKCK